MSRYFVIYQDDKEATVECFTTKRELADFIDEGNPELGNEDGSPIFVDLEMVNENRDPCYWGGYLIIKGDVVVPKPKEVVKEWEF